MSVCSSRATGRMIGRRRPAPFRAGPGMRLCLQGGQELTGLFLGLDRDQLAFRTAWTDRLAVPRRAVVALTHLPGWQPVRSDDLTGKLAGWTVQGGVTANWTTVDGIGQCASIITKVFTSDNGTDAGVLLQLNGWDITMEKGVGFY